MAFNAYMHERNIYKNPPDFVQIALDYPEFRKYAIPDAKGQKVRVDFTNTEALRMLTKILLKKDFNLDVEIPEGFLIPTVPQRLNYILWLEDLLSNVLQKNECVTGIDIGTGACAIFSILGAQKNSWKFVATESSDDAIQWAKKNIEKNNLLNNIKVVKVNQGSTLDEVLSSNEDCYDFCLCNPPFFENIEEIKKKHRNSNETIADVAQKEEIFFKGGEADFVKNILKDSLIYKDRISLFTSMFGKKKNFFELLKDIKEIKDAKFTTTEFCQGNTIRWGIAWTFNISIQFEPEIKKRVKPKKAKPPLEYQILLKDFKDFNLKIVVNQTENYLQSLEIPVTVTRSSQNFAELLLMSDKNTWTHQRRKRREVERQKKGDNSTDPSNPSSEIAHGNSEGNISVNESSQTISEKINLVSKGTQLPERRDICIQTEVSEKCSMDSQIAKQKITAVCTETEVPNVCSMDSQTDITASHNVYSESFSVELETQQNKRKGDFSSEELSVNKKPKTNVDEKTESLSAIDHSNTLQKDNESVSCIKTETVTKSSEVHTENISTESDKINQSHIGTSVKLESQNKKSDPSCAVIYNQNSSVSSPGDNICSSNDHSEEISDKSNETDKKGLKKVVDNRKNLDPEKCVLYCHLQFIKRKNKIYVKMNCPPEADRNTMYQVFQLIKNKINSF